MSDNGKAVIVTGGNNGIGFFITSYLLEFGYRVAVIDLSGENIMSLRSKYGDNIAFYKCDVTSADETGQTVMHVVSKWGGVDVLVNNACIAIFKPFEEKPLEETRREFEVNYYGYINMINAVLPHMKAAGSGIIHNVSSGVGITGFPGIYGYASTKGAIESLTRTLNLELKKYGITVNLMHPPLTDTKSSSPLGIPGEFMAKPENVGKALAKKVMSKKPDVTPDFQTTAFLWASRRYPNFVGRKLADMTEKSRAKKV